MELIGSDKLSLLQAIIIGIQPIFLFVLFVYVEKTHDDWIFRKIVEGRPRRSFKGLPVHKTCECCNTHHTKIPHDAQFFDGLAFFQCSKTCTNTLTVRLVERIKDRGAA